MAALAQRWSLTPAVLGGPILPDEGFGAVTVDTLGLRRDARHSRVRHTENGTYRLISIAPCATLSGCAALAGAEAPAGGGLLVIGTGETPEEAVAVLVLGPLVQIPLPAVPWGWVRELTTPATDPLLPRAPVPEQREVPEQGEVPEQKDARAPEPATAVAEAPAPKTRMSDLPQRARRVPKWRGPMPRTRRRDRQLIV